MTRPRAVALLVASITSIAAQPLFRSTVEVVEIDISVTRGGQPIASLTARDFIVTDNGTPQEISSITLEQAPLQVVLVLDVSRSLSGFRLAQLIGAGHELTKALTARDQASVITFSHKIHAVVPMTADMDAVRRGLSGLAGVGSTALRDAVQLAILARPASRESRPLILLFSDGQDTASWVTEPDVLESARRAGVVTHIVRFGPDAFLDRLAMATGGRTWSAHSEGDLRELFARALREMRSRYLITYSPRETPAPGWHAISVRLRDRRAEVTAKPGYFVVAPKERE